MAVNRIPARFRESISRRFPPKTRRVSSGCIEWTGEIHPSGYGSAYAWLIQGRKVHLRAHRLAWMIKNGPIPRGLCVCHKCDNPLCVKPAHLFLGTYKDNNQDMKRKGRGKGNATGCRDKLTTREVISIRKEHASGCVSYSALARKYGVARWSVSRIVRRKIRAHD
jgi:hypothetical protein